MAKKKRSRAIARPVAPRQRVGRKVLALLAVVAAIVVLGGVILSIAALQSSSSSAGVEMRLVAKAFNKAHNAEVVVSGGGKQGSLTVRFDSYGSYESIVRGGGTSDGELLSVGGTQYIKASEASLYATMRGAVALPVGRAKLYAREFANKWINMTGAPSVALTLPSHSSAVGFLAGLSGGALDETYVRNAPGLIKVYNNKSTWEINAVTNLPESYSVRTKHGSLVAIFAWGKVAELAAPVHSSEPPLPVNTSLSPDNYPTGLDPYSLVYTMVASANS